MNEIHTLHEQLILERQHVRDIARGVGAEVGRSGSVRDDGSRYLECVLSWWSAREERLTALAARLGAGTPARAQLEQALSQPGCSREALPLLARGEHAALRDFIEGRWWQRCEALEGWLLRHGRIGEWRLVAGLSAHAILEERERYARIRATAPASAPGI